MVDALASDRSYQPFGEAVLPRRARGDGPVTDAHGSKSAHDGSAVDPIPITDQVARDLIPRECFSDHVSNGALYSLQYDVVNDFEPISLVASFSSVIVARKSVPANDLNEFIAWLKAHPDSASQGSAGAGSLGHIGGVYFQNVTGTRIQHVPYRGSAPAMQDLVAGQIDMMIDAPVVILPQLRAGTIKALALLAERRLAQAAEVPTADEAGLPGFHLSNWFGLWAPKGTAKEIIGKLNAATANSLADRTVRQKFADLGFEIPERERLTPEALGAFQKAEIEKWWPIIKAANIKGD